MRASDRGITRIDVESLEAQARQSVDGEAYVQMFRSDACRIGVMAAMSKPGKMSFSIEVLFTEMNTGAGELISALSDIMGNVKVLTERGYVVDHRGDGWLIAWKGLEPTSINAELDQLINVIQKGEEKELPRR